MLSRGWEGATILKAARESMAHRPGSLQEETRPSLQNRQAPPSPFCKDVCKVWICKELAFLVYFKRGSSNYDASSLAIN